MSYRIDLSVTIQAPPTVVWDTIQDIDRRLQWDSRITSATQLTPLPMGKGTRTALRYRMLGCPMTMTVDYVVWKPPFQCGVRATLEGGSAIAGGSWHFTPNADGSTTWTTKLCLKAKPGRLAALRERIAGRYTAYLTRRSQQNLKRLVEREYGVLQANGAHYPLG